MLDCLVVIVFFIFWTKIFRKSFQKGSKAGAWKPWGRYLKVVGCLLGPWEGSWMVPRAHGFLGGVVFGGFWDPPGTPKFT